MTELEINFKEQRDWFIRQIKKPPFINSPKIKKWLKKQGEAV